MCVHFQLFSMSYVILIFHVMPASLQKLRKEDQQLWSQPNCRHFLIRPLCKNPTTNVEYNYMVRIGKERKREALKALHANVFAAYHAECLPYIYTLYEP